MERPRAFHALVLVAGLACMGTGMWLTLASVGGWLLAHVLPPGVVPALARALLEVAGDLAAHAWPLVLVLLGCGVVAREALRARREPRRERVRA